MEGKALRPALQQSPRRRLMQPESRLSDKKSSYGVETWDTKQQGRKRKNTKRIRPEQGRNTFFVSKVCTTIKWSVGIPVLLLAASSQLRYKARFQKVCAWVSNTDSKEIWSQRIDFQRYGRPQACGQRLEPAWHNGHSLMSMKNSNFIARAIWKF